jgi:hypothetical protein
MDAVATAKLALDASGMDRGLKQAQTSLARFAKTAATTLAAGFALIRSSAALPARLKRATSCRILRKSLAYPPANCSSWATRHQCLAVGFSRYPPD